MTDTDAELLGALNDPAEFARLLTGRPPWPHQAEVLRSPAKYRMICAGRQSGKSTTLAEVALHCAYTTPGALVMLVSAGEASSRRLLGDCAAMTASPLLSGSVLDEGKSQLTLTSGSQVISVPASQRRIRGASVTLAVVDEAGFVDDDLWRSFEPTIIAQPQARVVLASSPWGGSEAFFRRLWQRGMDRPDAMYQSWHWPSSISPMVDAKLLDEIRQRETPEYFNREYLAEWTDASGQFFSEREITDAVADYPLLDLASVKARQPWNHQTRERDRIFTACMGVDWGFAQDAQAIVLVSALDDGGVNEGDQLRYFIPWLEAAYHCSYSDWIAHIAELAQAWHLPVIASETNGVGAYPTEDLKARLYKAHSGSIVAPVWTDVRRKQSMFGKVKTLLQQGLLTLPREPELLKQLRALEFEQLQGGSMRIAVPDRAGHDDLVLALGQSVSCVRPYRRVEGEIPSRSMMTYRTTGAGTRVPSAGALPVEYHRSSFRPPSGREAGRDPSW